MRASRPTPPAAPPGLRRRACAVSLGALALGPTAGATAQAPTPIRHSLAEPGEVAYKLEALRLLLDRTRGRDGPYELRYAPAATQSRALIQLRDGELDVWASMTARDRDQPCLHRCLRRGLNGLRLPIALASRRAELETAAPTLEALRRLRVAQVEHWPDAKVLEHNGLGVVRLARLDSFPSMLKLGRADVMLLAADEAVELARDDPELVVLDGWAVFYPSVYSFFASPARPELLSRLERGWQLARADGSLLRLWQRHVGGALAQTRLQGRQTLQLVNPLLPSATPLREQADWHPRVWALLAQRPR